MAQEEHVLGGGASVCSNRSKKIKQKKVPRRGLGVAGLQVNGIPPLSSQVEPPSNQSSSDNNYAPSWPDQDKMVGMKRSYPFCIENPPIPCFNCNFQSSSICRSDDLAASFSKRYTPQTEPRNKYISTLREQNSNEDFLTLAPPKVATSNSNNNNYSSEFECMENTERLGQRGPI